MVTVTFRQPDGTDRTIHAVAGANLMRLALDHGVAGIVAECGGELTCASCHVYLADGWLDRVPAATPEEEDLLEVVNDRQPGSRLSCQLHATLEIDGICLQVADNV